MLGNVQALPISEMDFEVEISSRRGASAAGGCTCNGAASEMTAELLLERSERTVRQFRLLDGDVFEDMVVDDLFEILFRGVHVAQQLALMQQSSCEAIR